MSNLCAVNCIPIDIDYKFTNEKEELENPLKVWEKLNKQIIEELVFFPQCTYIEYSHRLRMVYVFDNPVQLPHKDKEKRESVMTWLRRISEEICKLINGLDPLYNAEVQKLTSFVRVPGSTNAKYACSFDANGEPQFSLEYLHRVGVKVIGEGREWEVHELSDFVLPDLPGWYEDYKIRKRAAKVGAKKEDGPGIHISDVIPLKEFLDNRINFLRALQDNGWDEGYRERMCFLVWNFALQAGYKADEAKQIAIDFNNRFATPMDEQEMLSKSRPRRTYKYRMSELLKELDVPEELANQYGYSHEARRTYKRLYAREYRKYQRAKRDAERAASGYISPTEKRQIAIKKAKALKAEGKRTVEIAQLLGVNDRTVRDYLAQA